jgi:hypothetical protein
MDSETKGKEYALYRNKNKLSTKRVEDILTGKILGYWGAPTLKKLKEFEKIINLDFNKFYNN